jgi:hypothetical protein
MPIFRMLALIGVRRTRIDAEHPLHAADDTAHDASNDGTDGASGLVADRGAMGEAARNTLGLGAGNQGQCEY